MVRYHADITLNDFSSSITTSMFFIAFTFFITNQHPIPMSKIAKTSKQNINLYFIISNNMQCTSCPSNILTHFSVAMSHILTVLSSEAEKTCAILLNFVT